MASDASVKLAVLIDADNAQPNMAGVLLAEIAKYGTAFVKRAYGDWTGSNLKGWKEQLLEKSIQPIQQFAYTFDGFCLVSSDSDFTRLASRIRESGLVVYGFGERKAPKALVSACDKFIYIENLPPPVEFSTEPAARPFKGPPAIKPVPFLAQRLIQEAIETTSDDDGWANLAVVGSIITKWHPNFDARSYGFLKISHMIHADPLWEVEKRLPGEGKPPVVYVRNKKRPRVRTRDENVPTRPASP